jgi:hypothetical protein
VPTRRRAPKVPCPRAVVPKDGAVPHGPVPLHTDRVHTRGRLSAGDRVADPVEVALSARDYLERDELERLVGVKRVQ